MQANTLPKALVDIAGKQSDRSALRMKEYGIWRDITWRQYLENVKCTALGLNHMSPSSAKISRNGCIQRSA
jgi:long-chain acyl-CoA synthetase